MIARKSISVLALLILSFFCFYETADTYGFSEKKSNVCGSFYPAHPKQLQGTIKTYLNRISEIDLQDRKIQGLISPHAGYLYSGAVAAYGYKALSSQKVKTIILLAPSHQ